MTKPPPLDPEDEKKTKAKKKSPRNRKQPPQENVDGARSQEDVDDAASSRPPGGASTRKATKRGAGESEMQEEFNKSPSESGCLEASSSDSILDEPLDKRATYHAARRERRRLNAIEVRRNKKRRIKSLHNIINELTEKEAELLRENVILKAKVAALREVQREVNHASKSNTPADVESSHDANTAIQSQPDGKSPAIETNQGGSTHLPNMSDSIMTYDPLSTSQSGMPSLTPTMITGPPSALPPDMIPDMFPALYGLPPSVLQSILPNIMSTLFPGVPTEVLRGLLPNLFPNQQQNVAHLPTSSAPYEQVAFSTTTTPLTNVQHSETGATFSPARNPNHAAAASPSAIANGHSGNGAEESERLSTTSQVDLQGLIAAVMQQERHNSMRK